MVSLRSGLGLARRVAPGSALTSGPGRGLPGSFRFAIALLVFSAAPSWGGTADEAFLDRWLSAQTRLESWSADILQTRHLATLTKPLTTPGHVWFVAPDRFRWELGQPPRSVAIREGETLWVLSPALRRAEKYSMNGAGLGPARDALALLDTGFPRDLEAFRRRFEVVQGVETNAVWRFRLRPRSESARKLIPALVLEIGAADLVMRATELEFADGSRLRNAFANAQAGIAIAPERFSPGVDATWKITEPTQP